jgi:AcrR family transcriptional regulator
MTDSSAPKKSDRTRSAILEAAKAAFGQKGYERATVREIARLAQVDPALVMRYFGSKDDLFALVADFDLALPELDGVRRSQIGVTLADHYLRVWESGTKGLPILLRSAASNEMAASHMREIFRRQVLPAVSRVSGKTDAAQRAALVASQLLGMALCRFILKLPPLVSMPRRRLVEEIGASLQRYITG